MKKFVLNKNHTYRDNVTQCAVSFIRDLPAEKSWEIRIVQHQNKRSDKQRAALFGVAYKAIMEATGLQGAREKEQLHDNMCGEYFGWKQTRLRGLVPVRTTTTDEDGKRNEIGVSDALDMYAFIQRKASEYGVYVPDPDPMWRDREAN